ncbi:EF-hand domain-containing protein [Pacificimonas sp. WHA3]|uniref:EF-hand domain-containing protein n=1 Tax=Pacificimonas pallii TaxID=2827236 RepID=A0ABS6SCB6_9SPHN|nr:EF-hand domain-containing protein [Pacificimonas pallii]MBV7256059.1 EF-hand domain-containing protein [Pacificimonas pallii]
MKTEFLVAASMATLFAAGGVLADHHGGKDKRNAEMTRADLTTRIEQRFARLDTDSDGAITQAEMKAMHEARMEKRAERRAARMAKADTDGNGALSAGEWEAMVEARAGKRAEKLTERRIAAFAALDRDNDGEISQTELSERHAMHRERSKAMHSERHGQRGQRSMRMLERADADKDGAVTLAELQTSALARFDRADANSDGTVTPDERRAARKARHDERRAERHGGGGSDN